MHGDIAQNQREVTMKRFKDGKFKVLVATDVASRGLDIPNVDLVIQLEPPKEVETYIHRSGRTARAGMQGTCITFYTTKTKPIIEDIERIAGIKLQRIGIPQAEDVIRASAKCVLNCLDEVNEQVLSLFEDTATELIEKCGGDPERALKIALAFMSGHYKTAIANKSLLTGQEKSFTIRLFNTQNQRLTQNNVYSILRKYWPAQLGDNVRSMRSLKNWKGVVFDVHEDVYERFMDVYEHVRS